MSERRERVESAAVEPPKKQEASFFEEPVDFGRPIVTRGRVFCFPLKSSIRRSAIAAGDCRSIVWDGQNSAFYGLVVGPESHLFLFDSNSTVEDLGSLEVAGAASGLLVFDGQERVLCAVVDGGGDTRLFIHSVAQERRMYSHMWGHFAAGPNEPLGGPLRGERVIAGCLSPADRNIYLLSHSGTLYRADLSGGKLAPAGRVEGRNLSPVLCADPGNGDLYGVSGRGRLWRWRAGAAEPLAARVPCMKNRDYVALCSALVWSGASLFGATTQDAYLFEYRPGEGLVRNLGRPDENTEIRAIDVLPDGTDLRRHRLPGAGDGPPVQLVGAAGVRGPGRDPRLAAGAGLRLPAPVPEGRLERGVPRRQRGAAGQRVPLLQRPGALRMEATREGAAGAVRKRGTLFRRLLEQYSILILVVAACALVTLFNPRFLTLENLVNLSRQIVPLGLLAIGAMFVLLGGGLDLSAGVGATVCGAALGVVFILTRSVVLAVGVGLAAGLAIGTVNGLLITRARYSAVVVTLAVMTMLQGGIQVLLAGRIVFLNHPFFQYISRGTVAGIPFAFLLLAAVFLAASYLLNQTRFGVYLYASGGSERNARVVGVPIESVRFATYLLSGLLMGVSGIVLVSRLALISPNLSGFPLLLNGVSAAVIGGISVTGGRGRAGGVFLGVIFIGVVSNAINFLNVTPEAQDLFRGLLVVFALIFQQLTVRKG